MDFYTAGRYDETTSTMTYFGYTDDGERKIIKGEFVASRLEAEVSVVGKMLQYAYENNCNIALHTNLSDAIGYANGKWKPTAKRICEYVRYIKKVTERIGVRITDDLTEQELKQLYSYMDSEQVTASSHNPFKKDKNSTTNGWKRKPFAFRVVVYDFDGKVLCDLTDQNFGVKNLADAVYFADWYEKQGNKVERYNVPKGASNQ